MLWKGTLWKPKSGRYSEQNIVLITFATLQQSIRETNERPSFVIRMIWWSLATQKINAIKYIDIAFVWGVMGGTLAKSHTNPGVGVVFYVGERVFVFGGDRNGGCIYVYVYMQIYRQVYNCVYSCVYSYVYNYVNKIKK